MCGIRIFSSSPDDSVRIGKSTTLRSGIAMLDLCNNNIECTTMYKPILFGEPA